MQAHNEVEQGVVLWEQDETIERWKGNYDKLLNEENPSTFFGEGMPKKLTGRK